MRVLCALVAGVILSPGAAAVLAQKEKAKEGDKQTAADTQIYEIGGKNVHQWIKEIPSKDRSKGENAIRTVVMFGADQACEAVPTLVNELNKQTSFVLVDVSIRVNAVMALGTILGEATKPDSEIVAKAVAALSRMLSDGQSIVKYRAAEALGKIGAPAKSAVKPLLTLIHDKNTWETRQAAATALGLIVLDRSGKAAPDKEVLNVLSNGMTDSASLVRIACIRSLAWLGPAASPEQKEALIARIRNRALTEKEEPGVRIWAHLAIMNIEGKASTEHLTAISSMLKGHEVGVRIQAAQALGSLGPHSKAAMRDLVAALEDKEPLVVFNCVVALGNMKKQATGALGILKKIAADNTKDPLIRQATVHAVDLISGRYDDVEEDKGKGKGKVNQKK